ncbi:M23 family metallopeptidase [Jiangella rhizosphaerae]|uniref:M23 family peptidase n=1 Tax=Jiangella rhizosphaerae TaxID=2293569 RepID=A0A418KUJ6_9ACTN|nr:M23 family metallopeptidase [Jiangella rhizosphaerae]RIQ32541.1 M23 family peptidase [Jiangella rhizosphaerae]
MPSVEQAQADLEAAQAAFTEAQQAERAAQQRAEQASQAAADARLASEQAAARAERARGESTDAAAAAEDARETLGRLAAHAYMNNSELTSLMQLGIADPDEFQARSTGVSELMRVQDSVLAQAAESRANATDAASRAEGHAAAAAESAAAATELAEQATAALEEASAATAEASEQLQKMREVHAAAERAAQEREEAENQPDRGDRDEGSTDAPPPPSGDGVFQRPSSGRVTSPYGMRVHPVTGVYKLHSGTDFGASCGSPVYAAYPGTVESTGYEGAYGNRIEISHGEIDGMDVTTTYSHLSAFSSSSGQTVAAGDLIGRVGTTGSSTGCHLHFEVLVNGDFTDPMAWLQ